MLDKRLVQEARPVLGYLLLTAALGLSISLLAVAQAWFFSQVAAGVFLEGATIRSAGKSLSIMLVIIVLRAVLQWLGEISVYQASARIKSSLRSRLIAHLVSLGPLGVRKERAGGLIATAVEGIESLEEYFSKYLPQLFLAAGIPLLILGFVFPLDWKSGLILLLTGPLIPFFMILIGKIAEEKSLQQFQGLSRMSAHFLDVLQGLTTLKVFGRSKDQIRVVERVSDSFRQTTLSVLKIAFLSALVLELLATISTALVAVTIGLRLVNGTLSYADGLFLLLLAPEFYTPLRTLGLNFHAGLAGVSAAGRIFEILDLPLSISDQADSDQANGHQVNQEITMDLEKMLAGDFQISFNQVTLIYPGETEPALKNIDLTINPGEKIALVGPSGAGKTSLAQLLLRFAEPAGGELLVNGGLLKLIPPEDWRAMIAYVPQNPYLFTGSITDNLRIARPSATLAEVRRAAERASAHEFIAQLPEGYDTLIGEGGARLSGGQVQRLAIARAFLKDAPLLILDEATSALDPQSEFVVQRALYSLMEGKTALIIAHRLSTVRQADRVLVLERGQLVEQGSPKQLISKQGLYFQLVAEYQGESL